MKKLWIITIFMLCLSIKTTVAQTSHFPIITPKNATQLEQIAVLGRGTINAIEYSPNGEILAVGGSLGIWLYNPNDLQSEPVLLDGHTQPVEAISFSPDGQFVASSSDDATIRIWNIQTGETIQILKGHTNGINHIDYSPDGQFISSGGDDKTVRIWDINTGELLHTLVGHTTFVRSVSYDSDGLSIASADSNTIYLWDAHTGNLLRSIPSNSQIIFYNSDGNFLIVGLFDSIQIYDTDTWQIILNIDEDISAIHDIAISPNSQSIAYMAPHPTMPYHHVIHIWDIENNVLIQSFDNPLPNYIYNMAYSPDGHYLSIASSTDMIIWDVENKNLSDELLFTHINAISQLDYSFDGKYIASTHTTSLHIWDTKTYQIAYSLLSVYPIGDIEFSPDNQFIAIGRQGSIQIWDIQLRELIKTLEGHASGADTFKYSPDGRYIVSNGYPTQTRLSTIYDNTIRIWDVDTGLEIQTIYGYDDTLNQVLFSSDGRFVISKSEDGIIRFWGIEDGQLVNSYYYDEGRGEIIIRSDNRPIAHIFDRSSIHRVIFYGSLLDEELDILYLPRSTSAIDLVYNTQENLLLVALSNNTIYVVDNKTGAGLILLNGHKSNIEAIQFSPDGQFIASGSYDGTVRIWGISQN